MARVRLRAVPSKLLLRPYRWIRLRLPQPWSRRFGQLAYLPKLAAGDIATRGVFQEEPLIERLVTGTAPLEHYGAALSERVVEIPWVWRRLPTDRRVRILDVGTAYAPMVYKWLLMRLPHSVEIADLSDAYVPGVRSHIADVRSLPFEQDSFDAAICISTLEHVGMDNTNYGIGGGGAGDVQGLRELGRIARVVFVTVPAGRDANMDSYRQYAPDRFRHVVDEAGLEVDHMQVFAHDSLRGWMPVAEDSVGDRTYQDDGAVAAAAVICAQVSRRT
jgi:hypothetical protein